MLVVPQQHSTCSSRPPFLLFWLRPLSLPVQPSQVVTRTRPHALLVRWLDHEPATSLVTDHLTVYSTKTKVGETKSTYYETKTKTDTYPATSTKVIVTSTGYPYTTTVYKPTASPTAETPSTCTYILRPKHTPALTQRLRRTSNSKSTLIQSDS